MSATLLAKRVLAAAQTLALRAVGGLELKALADQGRFRRSEAVSFGGKLRGWLAFAL